MRRPRRIRFLSEARAARILAAGGMVVETGGVHRVYRNADRRAGAIGSLAPHIVQRLEGLGLIALQSARPPRRVWTGPAPGLPDLPRAIAPPVSLMLLTRRGARESLLVRVLRLQTDRFLRVRLWSAAQRFSGDVERAATPAPMTMRWDGLPVTGQRAAPGNGGHGTGAASALARLAALEAALGTPAMRHLEALLVQQLGPAAFARAFDLSTDETERCAAKRLAALADAYDEVLRAKD